MQFTIIPVLLAATILSGCSVTMKMSDITGVPLKPAKPERVLARVPVPGPEVNGKPVRLPLGVPVDPDLMIDQRRTIRPEAQVEALRRATNMDGLIESNAVAIVGGAVVYGRISPSTTLTARTQPDPTEDASLPLPLKKMENKR